MDDITRPTDTHSETLAERRHQGYRDLRRSRIASVLVVVLCLAGIAWLAWYWAHRNATREGPGAGMRGRPTATVALATASRADIPIQLDALGTVAPVAVAIVRAQVSGVLSQIYFQEGQRVQRGDPLVLIDPRPFQLALNQAKGQLLRDQAELENARVILKRNQTLLAQDSIAEQDVQTQAATVRQLAATVEADRATVATAQLNLSYSRVVAPIDGRVGLRPVDMGNYVTPSDTSGVATITQVQPIDVSFALPADTVTALQKRTTAGAQLSTTAFDRTRTNMLGQGVFLTLDNQIDAQTGTIRAKARFANETGSLFPNQFVNVQIQLDAVKNTIVVPATAVRRGSQGAFVFVVAGDNVAHIRAVQVGPATNDLTSITSGLKSGERVVTEGGDRLVDGSAVKLPGAGRRVASANGEGNAGAKGHRRSRDANTAQSNTAQQ